MIRLIRHVRLEVFCDRRREWRWRLRHRNGNILADSGEGYTRRSRCLDAGRRLFPYAPVEVK